jgi:hypothetical protein
MKKNIAPYTAAVLLGFGVLLQTGCKKGAEPGTATNPKDEIFNIEYAIEQAGEEDSRQARIAMLRSAYDAAGRLNERWPGDPAIASFLKESADELGRIPETVYALSLEVNDLEAFKWAFRHSAVKTDDRSLMKYWALGPQWRDFIMATYPEQALPIYMQEAVTQRDVTFFNAHIDTFKAGGYQLRPPIEPAMFYSRYCRFMAEQFAAAMAENDPERIRLLLTYMPHYSDEVPLGANTVSLLKKLGDWLLYEQKDEALATTFIGLRYPLNRVDLSRIEFGSGFMNTLNADPEYAIAAVQLDHWRGPLGEQEIRYLLTVPAEMLKTVDQRYIDETVKLCLSKNKTQLALQLIEARAVTHPATGRDYDHLLNLAIQAGNEEFFRQVLNEREDMDIGQVDLVQLAANYDLFVRYAPRILTYIKQHENDAPDNPAPFEAICEVLMSTNHAAGAYLIEKYDLEKEWEKRFRDETLLMAVCLNGNLPAAKYLIETKRQNPKQLTHYSEKTSGLFGRADAQEGNLNLIHLAAKSGSSELIEYLASKKVSVNAQTYFGVTPLMYAVSSGHLEAVKTLLSLGAEVNTAMDESMKAERMPERGSFAQLSTAYRRAQYGNHKEIQALLLQAGARP